MLVKMEHKHPLSLVILGRPNVGKSTLFNRLVRKKVSIVEDFPGVTRDWQVYSSTLNNVPLQIYDTPGLERRSSFSLMQQLWETTTPILHQCDVILFLIDGSAPLHPQDLELATWLRKQQCRVILIANKCENKKACLDLYEGCQLGFGTPLPISAKHGDGIETLSTELSLLYETLPQHSLDSPSSISEKSCIQVAIVGRPNVGKSTFINQCLGDKRLLTGEQAGITRDAVSVEWSYKNTSFRLVDTAGLRKIAQVKDCVEKKACSETYHAIMFSQVVLLLIDVTQPIGQQDLTILEKVIHEGRGIVVILNKWDLIPTAQRSDLLENLQRKMMHNFSQGTAIPLATFSAITKEGFPQLWKKVQQVYHAWNKRIKTPRLNQFLQEKIEANSPPLVKGKRIKIKYITQIKTRPPTFVIFGNQVTLLSDAYRRYLSNQLIKSFALEGSSLRLIFRKTDNPFHPSHKK